MKCSIGFSTSNNPISRFIRWVTKSQVSHTWLLVDFLDMPVVLEAGIRGFYPTPASVFWKKNKVVCVSTVDFPLDDGLHAIGKWLGTKYDVAGLIGGMAVVAGRWLKRKWNNPVEGASALFCSEVVVRMLQAAEFPGADTLDPDDTTPEDLLDFLRVKKAELYWNPPFPVG